MLKFIHDICGIYSYQYLIRIANLYEFIFCIMFYTLPLKRKKHFISKLILIFFSTFLVVYFMAIYRTKFTNIEDAIILTFLQYIYIFLVLLLLYKETISELLLLNCTGIATQIIIGRAFETLLILFGKNAYTDLSFFTHINQTRDWIIYYSLHLFLSILLALIFKRKEVYCHDHKYSHQIVIFSLGISLITVPLNTISRSLEGNNLSLDFVIRIYASLYGILILFLRTGILEKNKLKQDLIVMEELLHLEKKHYTQMKDDISIINFKCHDIRQHISHLENKLTMQEIDSLQSAINIYDTSIKTGNDILDLILYKRKSYCDQNQIQLSCIADGNSLSFISPTHLYSLLSNAIENAIEAVLQIELHEKRIISISISKKLTAIEIEITNYFNGNYQVNGSLPLTTKSNKQHHGNGVKSMSYIVEKYNGDITFRTEYDIFYLQISFPINSAKEPHK